MNEGISVNVDINKYRIIRDQSCILILNIFSDFNNVFNSILFIYVKSLQRLPWCLWQLKASIVF